MTKEKEVKHITSGLVLSWISGIAFILLGLGFLTSLEIIPAITSFIIGSILLPPIYKRIKDKWNIKLSKGIKTVVIIIGFIIIGLTVDTDTTPSLDTETNPPSQVQQETAKQPETTQEKLTPTVTKPEYDLEMTMEEIVNTFSGLSEIQQEEKMKEFKGKRIKTSIRADKIDKATLSTKYVVMDMYEYPYNLIAYAKAFFPAEEKDNLLNANLGDTIIFSGQFVSYREGGLSTTTIEFTKSKFIGIEKE